MASATVMTPSGTPSMAARVEICLRPAFRRRQILAHRDEAEREGGADEAFAAGDERRAPSIQQRRTPFFSSMVVTVAVVTRRSTSKGSAHGVSLRPA